MSSLTSTIILSPFLIFNLPQVIALPSSLWLLIFISGIFMALYYVSLAAAYRTSDMSIVYPLTRSIPVLLVAIVTALLGQGKPIGHVAIAGIILVALGCLLLPMQRFHDWNLSNYASTAALLALLAGIGTTGYTIFDNLSLAIIRDPTLGLFSPTLATIICLAIIGISSVFWQGVGILIISEARRQFIPECIRQWRSAIITSIGIFTAYGLTLAAMSHVTNVSYIAAFRQVSIPIGTVAGIIFLKEPAHLPRITGALIILTGLTIIALT